MRIPPADKFWAFLGYLPVMGVLISWKVRRDSLFVQFHARQGALLFLLWLIAMLVGTILLVIFQDGIMNTVVFGFMAIISIFYLTVMAVAMLFKVLPGERWRMPIVADLALKFGL